jgi:hypothetical protein
MNFLDLPVELVSNVLLQAVITRGIKRALRLRLVNSKFHFRLILPTPNPTKLLQSDSTAMFNPLCLNHDSWTDYPLEKSSVIGMHTRIKQLQHFGIHTWYTESKTRTHSPFLAIPISATLLNAFVRRLMQTLFPLSRLSAGQP